MIIALARLITNEKIKNRESKINAVVIAIDTQIQ
jgi:hypothetical protein